MNWQISNINNGELKSDISFSLESNELSIFIDGYILPRSDFFKNNKDVAPEELIQSLYLRYGNDFINHIKGSFVIVIRDQKKILIYTDRHASVKCFRYQTEGKFIISNSLNEIIDLIELKLSKENAAIFTLFNHFIGDLTLYNDVFQLGPASLFTVNEKNIDIVSYWKPQYLFQNKTKFHDTDKLAQDWDKIIGEYHDYLKPKETALTLTGGNDSRMILAALLASDIIPLNMTYGNPKSGDVIVAKKICNTLDLAFKNYYVEKPTLDWFKHLTDNDIIPLGNSLVNIHRAHRIDAVKKLKSENPQIEMLFTGLVGGEYIKRPSYDNVTIPEIYQKWISLKGNKEKKSFITGKLQSKGLKTTMLNLDKIISELDRIIIPNADFKPDEIKFIHLHNYYAVNHHTQDPILFRSSIKYIVNPYMDIDFLESLSKSKEWYLNKKINSPLEKVWHSYLQVKITHILYPALSSAPFAKNGEYTGLEMLNSPVKYILKRGWKRLRGKNTVYERNFAMGPWLYEFSKMQLTKIEPEIANLFEEKFIRNVLEDVKSLKSEENWHQITAPLNLSINYHYFKKRLNIDEVYKK